MGGDGDKLEKDSPDPIGSVVQDAYAPIASCHAGGNALAALEPSPAPLTFLGLTLTPIIDLDPERPWLYSVAGPWTTSSIEQALYGANLAKYEEIENVLDLGTYQFRKERRLYPDLLKEPYRTQFHTAMNKLFERDVKHFENWLLDGNDSETAASYIRFYARLKDVRLPDGRRSYFDAFLARLKADTWHTDYLVTSSKSHPYLDLVYSIGKATDIHRIIGDASEEFGYYQPVALSAEDGKAVLTARIAPVDPQYISRASDMLMDRLEGITHAHESHEIVDLLTALPSDVQVKVLQHFMARYGSNERAYGIFSRSGEPDEVHMLYWLFEDLTSDDRKKLADAFRTSGILKPDAIDRLVEGRTWAGRNLPMTTSYGEKAAEFWADRANEGYKSAWVPGLFASLWTPETAGATIMTLAGARVFPAIAELSPTAGEVMLVGGTGLGAYQTTIALQSAITGKDPYSGKALPWEERLAAVLQSISGAILLGAGFAGASQMKPGGVSRLLAGPAPVPELPPGTVGALPAASAKPRISFRVLHENPDSGEFAAVIRDEATGEVAIVEGNLKTGVLRNPETGEVWTHDGAGGWNYAPPAPQLPAPTVEPATTPEAAPQPASKPQASLAPPPTQKALPPAQAATVPVEPARALTPSNVEEVIAKFPRKLTTDEIDRLRAAAKTKGEKWNLPDALRGEVAHILGDENLPRNFETIDRVAGVDEDGNAAEITSIKSHKLYSKSLQEPGAFLDTLKGEIDVLASFKGASVGQVEVQVGPNTARVLEVEVQPDTLSPETPGRPQGDPQLRAQWRAEAAEAVAYARGKGVTVRFKDATP